MDSNQPSPPSKCSEKLVPPQIPPVGHMEFFFGGDSLPVEVPNLTYFPKNPLLYCARGENFEILNLKM